jgi:hypothetical protein
MSGSATISEHTGESGGIDPVDESDEVLRINLSAAGYTHAQGHLIFRYDPDQG